jgi:DNA repair protein RadA/Sms
MAGKSKTINICQQCGYESMKWLGKCPSCGAWSSFQEESRMVTKSKSSTAKSTATPLMDGSPEVYHRIKTNIDEFDRSIGGGIVPGSVMIIGGDPGIGKSTLMLQILEGMKPDENLLYVSGEESQRQVQLRAERLGVKNTKILFSSETNLENLLELIGSTNAGMVIIDSIQTLSSDEIESIPGNISQLRTCTAQLTRYAKENTVPVIIVGHITKEGNIAGPKVLEHMVDTVLYFEGDTQYDYRILRCTKNRFGPVNEIGLFQMTAMGLKELSNPSEIFLSDEEIKESGNAIVAVLEGNRTFLIQIQALVSKTQFGMPQRTASGIDHRRMNLLLAVLEKRFNKPFGFHDVFLKVSGGLRIEEPAADFGICMALVSSLENKPLPVKTVYTGEIGLSGEVRRVNRLDERIREAEKLGFSQIMVPAMSRNSISKNNSKIKFISNLKNAFI